ncbi:sterol desaturase family protein [Dyadobacter psychrotolerans]|uniref:Sterol desaturase family protein n=1 Tax=Dyadobacter psychrotolerans TaxID=2541721 RepID=A0A4R5DMN8_9BACT|nr:sterol desaturase family protein [Dyadobacter psychrotolerans]TDE13251.1 sterol desaturase family protein [Dyadobacter psychrotolerans]
MIDYIQSAPDEIRITILMVSLALLWNAENLTGNYNKWSHARRNAMFVLTAAPVQFVLGLAFVAVFHWNQVHHYGLLNWIPFRQSLLAEFVTTFIMLDLFEYFYHVLMHKYKILWRFHLVHHSDEVVDVSSTLREHPGETAIRLLFTILWIAISGAAFWALMLRQFIQIFSNVLAHSNLRLPEKLDKILGWVFITPNLHHVHHHDTQPYTDMNFGDVLSIWDRLFGTFGRLDVHQVRFGVDTIRDESELDRFNKLLIMPFRPMDVKVEQDSKHIPLQVSESVWESGKSIQNY